MAHEETSVTTESCYDTAPFLGDVNLQSVTVVDTPGFGNYQPKTEQSNINNLVKLLTNEIRYVHAFVICFKQSDNRVTDSLRY